MMEAVVADENHASALAAVKRNHGAAGMDRMTTAQLEPHLQANGWILQDKLLRCMPPGAGRGGFGNASSWAFDWTARSGSG